MIQKSVTENALSVQYTKLNPNQERLIYILQSKPNQTKSNENNSYSIEILRCQKL